MAGSLADTFVEIGVRDAQLGADMRRAVQSAADGAQRVASDAGVSIGRSLSNGITGGGGGSPFRKLEADANDFGDTARRVASSIGSVFTGAFDAVRSAISGVGRFLSTAFTVGVGGAVLYGLKLKAIGTEYNNLEQTSRAAFKTILGTNEAAAKMADDIRVFARASPFPRQAFIEATRQFLGFGLAASQVLPTLDAIQNAVAATGGGAEQILQISDAMASVIGTGKLTGELLQRLGLQGIDAAKLIGQQEGKSAQEIRDLITSGKIDSQRAFAELVAGMQSTFGGAAANVKATWQGATDRIKGATRDIASGLTELFISKTGGGAAVTWANQFADSLRVIEAKVLPALTPAIYKLISVINPLMDRFTAWIASLNAGDVTAFIDKLKNLGPVLTGIATAIGTLGSRNIPILGGLVSGLNPLVAGLFALGASSPVVRDAFKDLYESIKPVLDQLGGALKPVLGQLGDAFSKLVAAVAPVLTQMASSLGPVLATIAGAFVRLVVALTPTLTNIIVALAPLLVALAQGFAAVLDVVGPLIGPLVDSLLPLFVQLADVLVSVAKEGVAILASILPTLVDALDKVFVALQPIIPLLGDSFVQIMRALAPVMPELAKALAQVALSAAELLVALAPIIPPLTRLAVLLIDRIGAPVLIALAGAVTQLAKGLALLAPVVTAVAAIVLGLEGLIAVVSTATVVAAFAAAVGLLAGSLGLLAVGLTLVLAPFAAVAGAVYLLWQNFGLLAGAAGSVRDIVGDAFVAVWSALGSAISAVAGYAAALPGQILSALAGLPAQLMALIPRAFELAWEAAKLAVAAAITAMIVSLIGLPVLLGVTLAKIGPEVLAAFTTAFGLVLSALPGLTGQVVAFFVALPGRVLSASSSISTSLAKLMGDAITGMVRAGLAAVPALISFVTGLPARITSAGRNIANALRDAGVQVINHLRDGAASAWSSVESFVRSLPAKIIAAARGLIDSLRDVGRKIMHGLWDGMKDIWGDITGWLSSLNPANWKGPPARDRAMLYSSGQLIMQGLRAGMESVWSSITGWLSSLSGQITSYIGSAASAARAAAAAATGGPQVSAGVQIIPKGFIGKPGPNYGGLPSTGGIGRIGITAPVVDVGGSFGSTPFPSGDSGGGGGGGGGDSGSGSDAQALADQAQAAADAAKTLADMQDVMFRAGATSVADYLAQLRARLAGTVEFSNEWETIQNQITQVARDAADAQAAIAAEHAKINDNMFTLGAISADAYLGILRQRLAQTTAFSDDFVAISQQIAQISADIAAQHMKIHDNEFAAGKLGTEEYLTMLRQRLAGAQEFSDAWLAISQQIATIEGNVAAEHMKIHDNEFAVGDLSNQQYEEILKHRLSLQTKYSDEWTRLTLQIAQMDKDAADLAAKTAKDAADHALEILTNQVSFGAASQDQLTAMLVELQSHLEKYSDEWVALETKIEAPQKAAAASQLAMLRNMVEFGAASKDQLVAVLTSMQASMVKYSDDWAALQREIVKLTAPATDATGAVADFAGVLTHVRTVLSRIPDNELALPVALQRNPVDTSVIDATTAAVGRTNDAFGALLATLDGVRDKLRSVTDDLDHSIDDHLLMTVGSDQ